MIELNFVSINAIWILIGCIVVLYHRKNLAKQIIACDWYLGKILLFIYMIPVAMMCPIVWIIGAIFGTKSNTSEFIEGKENESKIL